MKIITILGARPQFIKAAALSRAFRDRGGIEERIVHTGQHFDANMSEVFFREMDIPDPTWNLNINALGHGAMTGRMLEGIEEILKKEKPDYTLVYGDTNSTLAGALASQKLHIPVIHVEAGLRSFNSKMPEEVNRILTDRISKILFCPTETAIHNLHREGFEQFECSIWQSGDVMQDAAMFYAKNIVDDESFLLKNNLYSGNYVLTTLHRQENTDNPELLNKILNTLNNINNELPVVLPLHPRTKMRIDLLNVSHNLHILEPLGYFDMIKLIRNAAMVMTDSGGLQKEAYFFRKYCITLREQTEWTELVSNGYNKICGSNKELILDAFREFGKKKFWQDKDLYGGGNASEFIVSKLFEIYQSRSA